MIGGKTHLENLASRVGKSRDRDELSERMRGLAERLKQSKNHRRPDGVAPQEDAAEALIHSHTFLEDGLKQITAAILALTAPKNTVNSDLMRMLEEVLSRCDESRTLMADLLEQLVQQREQDPAVEMPFEVVGNPGPIDADFDIIPPEESVSSDTSIVSIWSQWGASDSHEESPDVGSPVLALTDAEEKPRQGMRL